MKIIKIKKDTLERVQILSSQVPTRKIGRRLIDGSTSMVSCPSQLVTERIKMKVQKVIHHD